MVGGSVAVVDIGGVVSNVAVTGGSVAVVLIGRSISFVVGGTV